MVVLDNNILGPSDLKLYSEVAVDGLKSYPGVQDEICFLINT
jgi:hypothetical protein